MTPTRRAFLAASLAALSGCSRGVRLTDATRRRITDDLAARRTMLAARPTVTGPFTTPPPGVNLLQEAAELKGLAKLAHRLHPTAVPFDSLSATQSHLGGPLDWPAGEPFPANADGRLLVPVLQLRSADAPGTLRFKPGTDLLQLFWDARFVEAKPRTPMTVAAVWRRSTGTPTPHPLAGLGERPDDPAWLREGLWPGYVPVPASFAPERVLEFPSRDILPERMAQRLSPSLPGGDAQYERELSVAPGTKVGGYAPVQPDGVPPACPECQWGMSYFLTISETEFTQEVPRWQAEGQPVANPAHLSLGPMGMVNLFACRRCEAMPTGVSC